MKQTMRKRRTAKVSGENSPFNRACVSNGQVVVTPLSSRTTDQPHDFPSLALVARQSGKATLTCLESMVLRRRRSSFRGIWSPAHCSLGCLFLAVRASEDRGRLGWQHPCLHACNIYIITIVDDEFLTILVNFLLFLRWGSPPFHVSCC
jgi:hypothetical protein